MSESWSWTSSQHAKRERSRGICFVAPCVARTLLDDHVILDEVSRRAVIKLQPDLSRQHNRIIESVSSVHPRSVGLESLGNAGYFCNDAQAMPRRSQNQLVPLRCLEEK